MNEPKNTDFFHEISERAAHETAPDIYQPYQETEEDLLHEERLKEIEAQPGEKLRAASDEELGELPYDAEADRKRWGELEKEFDRVFDQAEKINS